MRRFFQSAPRRLIRDCASPQMHCALLGIALGSLLLTWCFQWMAHLGTSLPVVTGLSLAMLVGLELGWKPRRGLPAQGIISWMSVATLAVLMIWACLFTPLLSWQNHWLGRFSAVQLANPGVSLAICFGFGLLLVAPPVFLSARLMSRAGNWFSNCEDPAFSTTPLWCLFGSAVGLLLTSYLLAPMLGLLSACLLWGCLASVALAFRCWKSTERITHQMDTRPFTANEALPPSTSGVFSQELWAMALLLGLGCSIAWGSRLIDQLLPAVVSTMAAKWASLTLGFVVAGGWSSRTSPSHSSTNSFWAAGVLGTWVVLLAAGFPLLLDLCLRTTSGISTVWLLTLCRLAVVCVVMVPLGWVWGRISVEAFRRELAKPENREGSSTAMGIPLPAAGVVAGWLLCQWVLLSSIGMSGIVIALACLSLGLLGVRVLIDRGLPQGWPRQLAFAGLCLLMLSAGFLAKNYRPQTSAQLLFAGPVFTAYQSDLDRDLLTALDEGRLLETREGRQGTYTLWRYRGVQSQLRQNGLPKGMASQDVGRCPDFSAEVLPAALPLTLHERPDTVLLLGLGSGVPLTTSLAFPTLAVTCVETDPVLIDLANRRLWQAATENPMDDPRLTLLPVDPALAIRSDLPAFDVIVSLPHQPVLASSTAYFTESFYRDAAQKLTAEGLFCQRFTQIDFGPEVLRTAARTMQAVFRDVVFLEMAGGEMLLIGTNSGQGVARIGFVDRLQKTHVRRQLASLGWDWSIPLNLTAFNQESLKNFASDNPKWGSKRNTSVNGTFAFRLPPEMMRWGPKPQENQQSLAAHVGRFAQWGGIDPQDPDLLRRLAEVTGQRKLMSSHPDEYWVYRKTVKEQVTKRPRAVVVQVKGELPRQEIHEDEKRRLAYFRALGDTVKHHPHQPEDIARVERFAEPYDPLITFFLHQEVAELHARSAERNYPAELAHRMHTVFFAAPEDRSVRNITAALHLLCDHPLATATALERWDHLDALLQMLKQRWAVRAGTTPTSTQVTLNDVEKSLEAVQAALDCLESIHAEADIATETWQARRRFLETTVVHPLRAYRRQLMPYHQRERLMREKKQTQAVE